MVVPHRSVDKLQTPIRPQTLSRKACLCFLEGKYLGKIVVVLIVCARLFPGTYLKRITQEQSILDAQVLRDSEGYLVDTDDWSEDFSEMVANEEGITLNELYWSVINFMRSYYATHQVAPDVRHVTRNIAEVNGCSKKEAKKILFDAFPYGYVKQACKIAGMKKPRAWSTG